MGTNWLLECLIRAQKPCKEKGLLLSNSLATALAAPFNGPHHYVTPSEKNSKSIHRKLNIIVLIAFISSVNVNGTDTLEKIGH